MARRKSSTDAALKELRAFGLEYPGAHTKSPWPGHLDLAVNDKTFAYLSLEGEPVRISCKLPQSSDEALSLPFTAPTEYGLGKSGWVSATFADDQAVPVDLLKQWIDESYRAQAPKRLSRGLAAFSPAGAAEGPAVLNAPRPKAAKKRAARSPAKKAGKPRAAAQRSAGKKRKRAAR
jgi:predicted DNA-binding protein (MmcQ/YjbR family)